MSSDQLALRPISPAPSACKICGGVAGLYGVVDFHKSCEELRGARLPLSGVPIYYRRSAACGFLFTDAFDDWSEDQFKHPHGLSHAAESLATDLSPRSCSG